MQRLRGVKQLGTAYLVYPGALHTRFDHMIGSLHMAGRMIEAVNRSFEFDPAGCVAVSEAEARVIAERRAVNRAFAAAPAGK
jgi:HD superfamily phosphohydrolase